MSYRFCAAVLGTALVWSSIAAAASASPPLARGRFVAARGAMVLGNGKAVPVSGVYLHSSPLTRQTAGSQRRNNENAASTGAVAIVNASVVGPFPANEPAIAIDPTNSAHVIASSNDYRFGDSQGGLYAALSRPVLFTDTVQQFVNSDPYYYNAAGDPAVGIDRLGIGYFGVLAFDRSTPGRSAVLVGKSLPSAMGRFVSPVPTAVDQQAATSQIFDDKDSLAVDNIPSSPLDGSLYSAFTQFGPTGSPIVAAFSRDQGSTFSKLTLVSLPGGTALCPYDKGACADNQGSSIAIGPKGIVYVAYENFDTVTAQNQILIAASTNGGATFGAPSKVADVFEIANPYASFRVNSFPNVAVNPSTGQLYVVWADQRTHSPEVYITTSTSGAHGAWSKPATVSPALFGSFRFFPAITISPSTANVYVSFYDNINFPAVDAYDYRYRRFSPSLRPLIAPTRLSQVAITPGIDFGGAFFGDYTSAAPTNNAAEAIWTGTSTGKQDIETAIER